MTKFDDVFVPLAIRLLAKFGAAATLNVITKGTYDGFTDTKVPDTTTLVPILAAPPGNYRKMRGSGDSIAKSELGTILSTVNVAGATIAAPKLTDTILIAGVTFKIVKVEPLVSGDLTAAYMLDLGKS